MYLLEFKVVELAGTEKALHQIKDKRYSEKYTNREVYLIDVEFSSKKQIIKIIAIDKREDLEVYRIAFKRFKTPDNQTHLVLQ